MIERALSGRSETWVLSGPWARSGLPIPVFTLRAAVPKFPACVVTYSKRNPGTAVTRGVPLCQGCCKDMGVFLLLDSQDGRTTCFCSRFEIPVEQPALNRGLLTHSWALLVQLPWVRVQDFQKPQKLAFSCLPMSDCSVSLSGGTWVRPPVLWGTWSTLVAALLVLHILSLDFLECTGHYEIAPVCDPL